MQQDHFVSYFVVLLTVLNANNTVEYAMGTVAASSRLQCLGTSHERVHSIGTIEDRAPYSQMPNTLVPLKINKIWWEKIL